MQTFLQKVIDHVFEKFPVENADRLCFVFPNRRAGLYFKMYLSEKTKKNVWAPGIFSAEDFIASLTGIEIIDNFSLLFRFYDIYKKVEGEKAQTLEEVLNWCPILLQDYNDADMYLADAEELFSFLSEAKAISRWELDNNVIPEHVKKYLEFYNSLGKYYAELKKDLLSKNQAYQGLAFRKSAENIEELTSNLQWDKIFFCGFNALTTAEDKIMRSLYNSGKADLLWDCDDYYFNNPDFEAGRFLRKIVREWKPKTFSWVEECFRNNKKNITITGISGSVSQTRHAGQLLSQINPENEELPKTAVVLADESLLIPMIYSVPKNISDLNITMGYKLAFSPLSGFFNAVSDMHFNAYRYSVGKDVRFYYKDINYLLSHHFFSYLQQEITGAGDLSDIIQKTNKVFYTQKDIKKTIENAGFKSNSMLSDFFNDYRETPLQYLRFIEELIGILKKSFGEETSGSVSNKEVYNEYLYSFAIIVKKAKDIILEANSISDFSVLHTILKYFLDNTSLPFYGEPLKGLQIMGMLETRNLDFENLIILSVNEGTLPAGKSQNSFIPFDIRTEFGLPTYKDKESIFAYHFYRLLQRAENIHILYNTVTDSLNGGEISRFLLQLKQELPKYAPQINIREEIISPSLSSSIIKPISISKTEIIINEMKGMAVSGFSPTALNTFIACPLRFYFQYIAKIKEPENTSETIDAATLGSAIHEVLQNIFEKDISQVIKASYLKEVSKSAEELTKNALEKHYPGGDLENGKNLLISKVALKYIQRYLAMVAKRIENDNDTLIIQQVEEFLKAELNIDTSIGPLTVLFKGKADRVDLLNGQQRIVDYKTGSTLDKNLKFSEWEDATTNPDKSIVLQLIMYSWLYLTMHSNDSIMPCIISLRNLNSGEKLLTTPDNTHIIERKNLLVIEKLIKDIICSIFDISVPFIQTSDEKACEYCSYSNVCKLSV